MLFAIDSDGNVEWYTPDTGMAFNSAYGNFIFKNPEASIVESEGAKYLIVKCMVNLQYFEDDDPFEGGIVDEIVYQLPNEFTMP